MEEVVGTGVGGEGLAPAREIRDILMGASQGTQERGMSERGFLYLCYQSW